MLDSMNLINYVCSCGFSADPRVDFTEVRSRIGTLGFEMLLKWNLLVPTKSATYAMCSDCYDFSGEVIPTVRADGRTQYYLSCPNCGSIEVDSRELLRWAFCFTPIVELMARWLHARGSIQELVPGKLWNIGYAAIAGYSRPIYVGRCFIGRHGEEVLSKLPSGKSSLLFAISDLPPDGLPGLDPDRLFELRSLIYFEEEELRFDLQAVLDQVGKTIDTQTRSTRKRPKSQTPQKRDTRASAIDKVKRELHEHILSMKSLLKHADDVGREVSLPYLTQKELAQRTGISVPTVYRILKREEDPLIVILWQTTHDPDLIRDYKRRP